MRPMLVQYLVGLCCLHAEPSAVEIILGDMVPDSFGEKDRDVDITITVNEAVGTTSAFKAFEVKRLKAPLGIEEVEGLCQKLSDMEKITHRAIVSTSGFTRGALNKARNHGVQLYNLEPWVDNMESMFPNWGLDGPATEVIQAGRVLLVWSDYRLSFLGKDIPAGHELNFDERILTATGKPHRDYGNFGDFCGKALLKSTDILCSQEPAQTILRTFPRRSVGGGVAVSPPWPHTHTIDLYRDKAYLLVNDHPAQIESLTINGTLQWRSDREADFYIMRNVFDDSIFAGAIVMQGVREGNMTCIILGSNSETAHIHPVQLTKKHLNILHKVAVTNPSHSAEVQYEDPIAG